MKISCNENNRIIQYNPLNLFNPFQITIPYWVHTTTPTPYTAKREKTKLQNKTNSSAQNQSLTQQNRGNKATKRFLWLSMCRWFQCHCQSQWDNERQLQSFPTVWLPRCVHAPPASPVQPGFSCPLSFGSPFLSTMGHGLSSFPSAQQRTRYHKLHYSNEILFFF
jgi:hypothetical protein